MRAQITVDFIIILLVVLSIFSVLMGIYITKSRGVSEVMSKLESERIGENIAWSVNGVSRGGDGARMEIYIPDAIDGEAYYVSVQGRWVEVVWSHGGSENHLAVPLMTNSTKGNTFMPGSLLTITNRGGIVEVS